MRTIQTTARKITPIHNDYILETHVCGFSCQWQQWQTTARPATTHWTPSATPHSKTLSSGRPYVLSRDPTPGQKYAPKHMYSSENRRRHTSKPSQIANMHPHQGTGGITRRTTCKTKPSANTSPIDLPKPLQETHSPGACNTKTHTKQSASTLIGKRMNEHCHRGACSLTCRNRKKTKLALHRVRK